MSYSNASSTSSDHASDHALPVVDARKMYEAWLTAARLISQRDRAAWQQQINEMNATVAKQRADLQDLTRDLSQVSALLDNVAAWPVIHQPTSMAAARQRIRELEGTLRGNANPISIDTEGLDDFVILGQVRDADGEVPSEGAMLLSYRFLDAQGRALDVPDWVRISKVFGGYRYLAPDAQGWFDRRVVLPEGTVRLEISAHDFRPMRKEYKDQDLRPLMLSNLHLLSTDVLTQQYLNASQTPDMTWPEKTGAVHIDKEGVECLIQFNEPVRSVQFELSATVLNPKGGDLVVAAWPVGGKNTMGKAQEVRMEGSTMRMPIALQGDRPFTRAIMRLSARTKSRPVLLTDRVLRQVAVYPDQAVRNLLMQPKVLPETLNTMSQDWERRGKWFSVYEDIESYEGPAVLVTRLAEDAVPLTLGFSVAGAEGVSTNKGMVLSVFFYSDTGERLKFTDSEFAHSPAVGNFRYVPVSETRQEFLTRLPMPAGAAYMGVCLQNWQNTRLAHVAAAPVLGPTEAIGRRFEEIEFAPDRDVDHTHHGVYAQIGDNKWRGLLPNVWEKTLDTEARQILIRIGEDAPLSVWRDIADTLHSPDTRALRAILDHANRLKLPIVLDVSQLPRGAALPFNLIHAATQVRATENQAPHIRNVTAPGAVSVVEKDPN
ncbi:hypothetical protein [Marinovum sp.]|uniref:hypothetical protein n=1 Tax=Marinovum sp. TaxID=2024839 RepID=UPI003A90061C